MTARRTEFQAFEHRAFEHQAFELHELPNAVRHPHAARPRHDRTDAMPDTGSTPRPTRAFARGPFAAAFGAALLLAAGAASAAEEWPVTRERIADEKAVFATVESSNVIPARARIGGTIVALTVARGDAVEAGQVIAQVVDDKLALQLAALDAGIAGLKARLAQAEIDISRIEPLSRSGTVSKAQLDSARTALDVARQALNARVADRSVVVQQQAEGDVLAPAAGRVLNVPVTVGTVVLAGETVVQVADRGYLLRLRVPERHARFLKAGDPVRIDGADLGADVAATGVVTLVYPKIEDGRVVADAKVDGLGDYFVGQRVRVWVSGGDRAAYVVPSTFVETRFGVDYVRLKTADGTVDVPVQRGRPYPRPALADGIEILSGVKPGDVLVRP